MCYFHVGPGEKLHYTDLLRPYRHFGTKTSAYLSKLWYLERWLFVKGKNATAPHEKQFSNVHFN